MRIRTGLNPRIVAQHYGAIDRPGVFSGPGPIWESTFDRSAIRGRVIQSIDVRNTIPTLVLEVVEHVGAGQFSDISHIVRDKTTGGLAPTGACRPGELREVPYTARYCFYAPKAVVFQGIPDRLLPQGELLLRLNAKGSQIYECRPSAADPNRLEWALFSPNAMLTEPLSGLYIGDHFGGVLFPALKLSNGPWWVVAGSFVRGSLVDQVENPGTIPSFLLNIVERKGNGVFDGAPSIVRYNLTGGLQPTTQCRIERQRSVVPYTATYAFFGATS
jgi:hypothetical protein